MSLPILRYDPDVDTFGSRILEMKSGKRITYEEAYKNRSLVDAALQPFRTYLPDEFKMFVLRKMAVHEKDFKRFKQALPKEALDYLMRLIGLDPKLKRFQYRNRHEEVRVHPPNTSEAPSTYRGVFARIFCKKIFSNSNNQPDDDYDNLLVIFPFKIIKDVPDYEIEILNAFDDSFYSEIQQFLDQHFSEENAREICSKFLKNIRHFVETFDPEKSLRKRLEAKHDGTVLDDYLTTFPRLNRKGIIWMTRLYAEYNNIQERFKINVPMAVDQFNMEYFRDLPETNFVDLYSLLEPEELEKNRQGYVEKFQKYLFFFVHASEVESNPIFVIDELLFECAKSLFKYKTVKGDIEMVKDLARISVLHLRMKPKCLKDNYGCYSINEVALNDIKNHVSSFIEEETGVRLNVKYKTELLSWMAFRTDDTYFNVTYSKWPEIKHFRERVICSVLCPDEDPVRRIVSYNPHTGTISKFDLPDNVDSLKNFIKLCNTVDLSNESAEKSIDLFRKEFDQFTETEKDE